MKKSEIKDVNVSSCLKIYDGDKITDIKKVLNHEVEIIHSQTDITDGKRNKVAVINTSNTYNFNVKKMGECDKEDYIEMINELSARSKRQDSIINDKDIKITGILNCFADEKSVQKLKEYNESLYDDFDDNHKYCDNCKEYVKVREMEQEIYDYTTDEEYLRLTYYCEQCDSEL